MAEPESAYLPRQLPPAEGLNQLAALSAPNCPSRPAQRPRTDLRMKNERKHAAGVLAQERTAADDQLRRQIEHSDAQFREEGQRFGHEGEPACTRPVGRSCTSLSVSRRQRRASRLT
jgi:hypothetical protein